MSIYTQEEAYRDTIGTLDSKGKRRWLYPKSVVGRFERMRSYLAAFLLVFLFGSPWIRVNGNPFLLFNIIDRKFVLFGQPFWPQDFHLFVLGALASVLFLVLFTVIYGRIFCGWVCPQTIFMEHVFRRVEKWIEGDAPARAALDRKPWSLDKFAKKLLKHSLFMLFSFLVGNTFLAYVIGVDSLLEIVSDHPSQHLTGLASMLGFTFAFYFVFSVFREQVCIIACPYGRLQGVLLDNDSIVVAYDHRRGEPRGIRRKGEDSDHLGDCIDCKQCVAVCPTGIDIRNGTQLECINCTACIDACDNIMDRIQKPRGLVRYASDQQIQLGTSFKFTRRMGVYSAVLSLIVGVFIFLLATRSDFELSVLRMPGTLYSKRADGAITNIFKYQLVNKTMLDRKASLRVVHPHAQYSLLSETQVLNASAGEMTEGMFIVSIPPDRLNATKTAIVVEVYSGDRLVDHVSTNFTGPIK